MSKQSSENSLHIKLEYGEAIQSKRDTLSSQANLLKIIQSMKRYSLLRKKEIALKQKLYRELKRAINNIKKIESSFPEPKVPKSLKHPEKKETKDEDKQGEDKDIENQLKDIQKRLNQLANS